MSRATTRTRIGGPRDNAGGRGSRDRLPVVGGLSALSLDAMACVPCGPQTMVLSTAGDARQGLTLQATVTIAVLLAVPVFSCRQVIAAFPALLPCTVQGTLVGPAW